MHATCISMECLADDEKISQNLDGIRVITAKYGMEINLLHALWKRLYIIISLEANIIFIRETEIISFFFSYLSIKFQNKNLYLLKKRNGVKDTKNMNNEIFRGSTWHKVMKNKLIASFSF